MLELSSENLADGIAVLSHVTADNSIELSDPSQSLTITAEDATRYISVLNAIQNVNYSISVADSAVSVSQNFTALTQISLLNGITLNDPETPILSLSVSQLLENGTALNFITNPNYKVAIQDYASSISGEIDTLESDARVSSITFLDTSPTLYLSAQEVIDDGVFFAEITNSIYSIVVSDTAENVANNLLQLGSNDSVNSIKLTDGNVVPLVLSVAQLQGSSAALSKIVNQNYSIQIADTASNISANLDLLNENASVKSLLLIDADNQALSITVQQALTDSRAISLIGNTNSTFNFVVRDSAANLEALSESAIEYLGQEGVQTLDSSDVSVSFSIDQRNALADTGIAVKASPGHSVTENFSDGSSTVIQFTVDGDLAQTYDASGGILSSEIDTASGHVITTNVMEQPYTSVVTNFDQDFKLISSSYLNADQSVYATQSPSYSTDGSISSIETDYYDGSKDVANFNSSGALISRRIDTTSGYSTFIYQITGQLYDGMENDYDLTGNLQQTSWYNTDGSVTVQAYVSNRTLNAGTTLVTLIGNEGNDTFVYSSQNADAVIISHADAQAPTLDNALVFNDLNISDLTFERSGSDLLIGVINTGKIITITSEFVSNDHDGVQSISFSDATVWNYSDILASVSTADYQTYNFTAGDGNETLSPYTATGSRDVLSLNDLTPTEVVLSREVNGDLLIGIKSTGEIVTVQNQWYDDTDDYGIASIHFSDGTTYNRGQITNLAWVRGTDANDDLSVYGEGTTVDAGLGDDSLHNDDGSTGHTYLYASGDSNDTINVGTANGSTDVLKLTDLNAADVQLSRVNSIDLEVKDLTTGQTILVQDQWYDDTGDNGVNQIVFANGTIFSRSDILAQAWNRGTSGDDTLYAYGSGTSTDGGQGDDYIGNNGEVDQTYLYASGDGNDEINVFTDGTMANTLKLNDLDLADVELSRTQDQTLIVTNKATGESIQVLREWQQDGDRTYGISAIQFADGTTLDQSAITTDAWIRGTDGDDQLYVYGSGTTADGGLGDDYLTHGYGESGQTYVYAEGDGNDEINAYTPTVSSDVLKLTDLDASDIQLTRTSDKNLLIETVSNGQVITVDNQFYDDTNERGLSAIQFANGTTWDRSEIASKAVLVGTDANDDLSVYGEGTTVDAGLGDDSLHNDDGLTGHTYLYASGDGNDTIYVGTANGSTDVLKLTDLNQSDVQLSRVNSIDLEVKDLTTGQTILVQDQWYDDTGDNGVNQIVFADGTTLSRSDILAQAWNRGTSGDDTLYAYGSGTTTDGGQGDDYVGNNGEVDQTYLYASGNGNDEINVFTDGTTTNTLKLSDLNIVDVGLSRTQDQTLIVTDKATGESIQVLREWQQDGDRTYGISAIQFADGTTLDQAGITTNAWIRGTDGDDQLYVYGSGTTADGGLGDDYLTHGYGESGQTYVYAEGDGNDEINAYTPTVSSDVLKLTDLNPNDIQLTRTA